MSAPCPICERIASKKGLIVESDKVAVLLPDNHIGTAGVWLAPKQHSPIIEGIPDAVVSELFLKANRVSIALFEALGVAGTNIFWQNGLPAGQKYPHALLQVLARKEGDSLQLNWTPKEIPEPAMNDAESKLKTASGNVGQAEPEKPKPIPEKKPEKKSAQESAYLIHALRRLP